MEEEKKEKKNHNEKNIYKSRRIRREIGERSLIGRRKRRNAEETQGKGEKDVKGVGAEVNEKEGEEEERGQE